MKLNWLAVKGRGVDRMTTWIGETRIIVVSGMPDGFWESCPTSVEVPDECVTEAATRGEANEIAARTAGVIVTVFR